MPLPPRVPPTRRQRPRSEDGRPRRRRSAEPSTPPRRQRRRPALGQPAPRRPPKQDDALDLGATVLPILAKTYWKQGVAVLVLIALVVWLLVR